MWSFKRAIVSICALLVASNVNPALAQDTAANTMRLFAAARAAYSGGICDWKTIERNDAFTVSSHRISFRYAYEEESGPDRELMVHEVPCFTGAYNLVSVWFIEDEFDGLRPLHFAEPVLDICYADEENETVDEISITGFSATAALVNGFFDPDTTSITSFSKWRGLGDASSTGVWMFENGRFVLASFAVDATYDGEINSIKIYNGAN